MLPIALCVCDFHQITKYIPVGILKFSLRCNRDGLSIGREYRNVGSTRVLGCVVVGVVVRDVEGSAIVYFLSNTGRKRFTRNGEMSKSRRH